MKRGSAGVLLLLSVLATAASAPAIDLRRNADLLWSARGDLSRSAEAVSAHEAYLRIKPYDYETLIRLSRLHYWIGQNLETSSRNEALAHYARGRDYARTARESAPDRPGGYFFEAANLGRENLLKGPIRNLLGIGRLEELNRKAASIQREYHFCGPDRFYCAYYAKLPGLLGGSSARAVEHGRRAVAAFPNYAGNRYLLAEAYLKDGKGRLARRELEAALAIPDDACTDAVPEQRLEKRRAAALLHKIGK